MGGPGINPCGYQGVVFSTVGKEPMYTEIVPVSTVRALMGWGLVGPESCVAGITQPIELEPKRPLVPRHASETQRPPRQGVETLVGVAGRKVRTPSFMGWQDQLIMAYHVPRGSGLGGGGGRALPILAYPSASSLKACPKCPSTRSWL